MAIISFTYDRAQNQAGKLLTGDSYVEENVFSGELREHWLWKTIQEKELLSAEMHPHLEKSKRTVEY